MSVPLPPRRPVVAIDGPSGSGKSTVARRVARKLGWRYLDTGAMYRALTWRVLDAGLDPADPAAADGVVALARATEVVVGTDPARPSVRVDGVDVAAAIRGAQVTAAVSAVAALPGVRELLVQHQRELARPGQVVVEGRDIGTTVLPEAAVKVFLTASERTRARRRQLQLAAARPVPAAPTADLDATRAELARRDHLDRTRAASPLQEAPDALVLDSTRLSVGQVVDAVLAACRAAGLGPAPAGADDPATVS